PGLEEVLAALGGPGLQKASLIAGRQVAEGWDVAAGNEQVGEQGKNGQENDIQDGGGDAAQDGKPLGRRFETQKPPCSGESFAFHCVLTIKGWWRRHKGTRIMAVILPEWGRARNGKPNFKRDRDPQTGPGPATAQSPSRSPNKEPPRQHRCGTDALR